MSLKIVSSRFDQLIKSFRPYVKKQLIRDLFTNYFFKGISIIMFTESLVTKHNDNRVKTTIMSKYCENVVIHLKDNRGTSNFCI